MEGTAQTTNISNVVRRKINHFSYVLWYDKVGCQRIFLKLEIDELLKTKISKRFTLKRIFSIKSAF